VDEPLNESVPVWVLVDDELDDDDDVCVFDDVSVNELEDVPVLVAVDEDDAVSVFVAVYDAVLVPVGTEVDG
jgi:hypothetical protein